MRLVLNAPARPLSAVIRTNKTRRSSRRASSGFSVARSSPAAAAATLPRTLRSIPPYGREAMVRSCARRSFAAETIFMALVICCVFLTERMRRRISIRLGICLYRRLGLRKSFLELLHSRLDLRLQVFIQHLFGPDVFEDGGVSVIDEFVQLFLEPAAILHGDV